MAMDYGWPLEAENGPHMTTKKEVEISILQLKATEFCQQLQ